MNSMTKGIGANSLNKKVGKPMSSIEKFEKMVRQYPYAAVWWDFEQKALNLEGLEKKFGCYSHGEQLMLAFFVYVWKRQNLLDFNLCDAAWVLDYNSRILICEWIINPCWP